MPWEPSDEELAKNVPACTKVYHTSYPTGFLTRIARKLLGPDPVWLPRGLTAARKAARETKPDVILTSGPPHWVHFIGLYLKKMFHLPWIADLRDPWVPRGDVGKVWLNPSIADKHGEKQMMKHASAVIANAPIAQDMLHNAYPQFRDKIHMITNGFDPEYFAGVERPASSAVRVVHTGELYVGRDPRTFLDALATLMREPGPRAILAEFLGRNTGGKFDLDTEVKQRALEAIVSVGGQVSYQQSLKDMATADILLLLDGPGRKLGVPAKLYEYLGAGRPILALTEPDGDSGWVLRQSGIPHRMIAPPGDPADIRRALLELVGEVDRNVVPDRERLNTFTRAHMAEQVAALLEASLPESKRAHARSASLESVVS
jgi:glycosyltransferase involved in cell wall biosynthesis